MDAARRWRRESGEAPLISVVMPVFNKAAYLEEAIASVLNQTLPDLELLVIDDASTDGSLQIARRYAARDSRVRLLQNPQNRGVAYSRNRGISEAQGAYIALLDGDDIWYPEKLEKQLRLAQESGAELIFCSYAIVDGRGRRCCPDFIVPPRTDREQMLVRSVISCSTALIETELLRAHPFREDCPHEDYLLWLELLGDGCRTAGCPEVLAAYRLACGSRSQRKLRCALGRWHIYREDLTLPLGKSLRCFAAYGWAGLKKYRRA